MLKCFQDTKQAVHYIATTFDSPERKYFSTMLQYASSPLSHCFPLHILQLSIFFDLVKQCGLINVCFIFRINSSAVCVNFRVQGLYHFFYIIQYYRWAYLLLLYFFWNVHSTDTHPVLAHLIPHSEMIYALNQSFTKNKKYFDVYSLIFLYCLINTVSRTGTKHNLMLYKI